MRPERRLLRFWPEKKSSKSAITAQRYRIMAPQPPDSAAAWARELATADGNRPQQLLQHLYALQQRYAHVPPAAQDQLASRLGLTRAEVRAVVGFYAFLNQLAGWRRD